MLGLKDVPSWATKQVESMTKEVHKIGKAKVIETEDNRLVWRNNDITISPVTENMAVVSQDSGSRTYSRPDWLVKNEERVENLYQRVKTDKYSGSC